jgi:hypothetical protein
MVILNYLWKNVVKKQATLGVKLLKTGKLNSDIGAWLR